MENYYEPFLGGGSILLGLLHKQRQGEITVRGEIHASDANPHLIGFYKNVQSHPDELLHHARELLANCPLYESKAPKGVNRHPATAEEAKECTETYYYWIRTQFNSLPKDQQQTPFASALFLFLNKTCFRGVYREGPNGFNVPFGNYKNPAIIEEEHLREVSEMIQPVLFHTRSFTDPSLSPTRGDFVYANPPYAPEKETSFVGYTSNGFDLEAHEKFFEWCNQQKEGGVRLLISNADVPLVQNAFNTTDWIIQTVVCRRAIHSKTPNATTQEVLITSVPS